MTLLSLTAASPVGSDPEPHLQAVLQTLDARQRRCVEQALRVRDLRFVSAMRSIRGIVWEFDLVTGAVQRSEGLHDLIGVPADEAPPTPEWWYQRVHPEDLGRFASELQHGLRNEDQITCDYRVRHADGRWIDVWERGLITRDAEGRAISITGFTSAITEWKRAEDALQANEQRLQSHVDASPLAVIEWDAKFVLTRWAGTAERLFGWRADEAIGRNVAELNLVHPDDLPHVERVMARLTDGSTRQVVSTNRNLTRDGRVIHCTWYNSVLFDVDGRMASVLSLVLDETHRMQAENALRDSVSTLRSFYASSPLSMGVVELPADDSDVIHVYDNPATERFFGVTGGGTAGRSARSMGVPDEVLTRWICAYRRSEREGAPVRFEYQHPAPHGPVWLSAVVSSIGHSPTGLSRFSYFAEDITRRRQSEQALRESEERLRQQHAELASIYQHAPVGLAVFDRALRYVRINDRLAEINGLPVEAHQGRWLGEVVPEILASVERVTEQVLATGEPVREHESTGCTPSQPGVVRTWSESWYPLRDASDEIIGFGAVVEDITERKRAELALRSSEERFRQVFENAATGIAITDWSGCFEQANRAYCNIIGYTETELRGTNVGSLIWPDDAERNLTEIERLRHGETSHFELESRYRRKNGSPVWAHKFVSALRDEHDRNHFVALVTDVTERRRAQAALEGSEQRLALALEAGQLGLWDWNIATGHVLFGGRFESMLGYKPGELAQDLSSWSQRIHPDDLESVNAELNEHLAGRSDFYECEHRLRHKDGSWRWILDRGKVVERDDEGRPLRAVGTHTDVTKRRQAEEALRADDRRKDEFLATLAHELRNPLAPIANAVQILNLKGPREPTLQAARDVIDRQTQHMVRLVDDLLDISRITRGKLELRRETVTLACIAEQALEASRPHIDRAGHRLQVSLPEETLFLDVDLVRIAQVISNLLNNAAKYTEAGGLIQLVCAREDGDAVIRVRDTGIGISAEHLPRVFEMFSQEVAALDRSEGGLGIGLALARGIVEMHGGRIEARSDGRGKGSEFVVRLHLSSDQTQATGAGHDSKLQPAGATKALRVLVVDDNQDSAESLALLLGFSGHAAEVAHDGSTALEIAERQRPQLVLLDLGMPKMNGYEVCRALRKRDWAGSTRIAAVTGWGQDEDRRRTREAGFDAHLVKPVSLPALMSLLATTASAER